MQPFRPVGEWWWCYLCGRIISTQCKAKMLVASQTKNLFPCSQDDNCLCPSIQLCSSEQLRCETLTRVIRVGVGAYSVWYDATAGGSQETGRVGEIACLGSVVLEVRVCVYVCNWVWACVRLVARSTDQGLTSCHLQHQLWSSWLTSGASQLHQLQLLILSSFIQKSSFMFLVFCYLEFGVFAEDHLGQVSDGPVIHHSLGQLWCVFADLAQRGSRDAFEGHLGLLETQQQQRDGACVCHRLSQRCAEMGRVIKNK